MKPIGVEGQAPPDVLYVMNGSDPYEGDFTCWTEESWKSFKEREPVEIYIKKSMYDAAIREFDNYYEKVHHETI